MGSVHRGHPRTVLIHPGVALRTFNPTGVKAKHYCYIFKDANGLPFYVGAGSYGRAITLCGRSDGFKKILAIVGRGHVSVELIPAVDRLHAFWIEALTIQSLKKLSPICNVKDGSRKYLVSAKENTKPVNRTPFVIYQQ